MLLKSPSRALAVSNDEPLGLVGLDDGTLDLWDIAARTRLASVKADATHAMAAGFLEMPGEPLRAYSGGYDKAIKLWRVDDRTLVADGLIPTGCPCSVSTALLDGRRIVVAPRGRLLVADVIARTLVQLPAPDRGFQRIVSFRGADGERVVRVDADGSSISGTRATDTSIARSASWEPSPVASRSRRTGSSLSSRARRRRSTSWTSREESSGRLRAIGGRSARSRSSTAANGSSPRRGTRRSRSGTRRRRPPSARSAQRTPRSCRRAWVRAVSSRSTTGRTSPSATSRRATAAASLGIPSTFVPAAGAISSGGPSLALGAEDGTLRVYDIENLKRPPREVKGAHEGAVSALAFDPTGTALLDGGADGRVVLRDAETLVAKKTLEVHSPVSIIVAGPGSRALIGVRDHTVRAWDYAAGELLLEWKLPTFSCEGALSASGERLAVSTSAALVHVLEVRSGRELAQTTSRRPARSRRAPISPSRSRTAAARFSSG